MAPKFLASQLRQCSILDDAAAAALGAAAGGGGSSQEAWRFAGLAFRHVRMQGYVVAKRPDGRFVLDDSTGIVVVAPILDYDNMPAVLNLGDQVSVRGAIGWNDEEGSFEVRDAFVRSKAHLPDAMAVWFLEVCHVHRHSYLPDEELDVWLSSAPAY
ncbi:hypothetical protein HK405_009256 [Cladochytrium tenue]|nr:hypothetical protein HK405_009256 [Cladochytrium tenue]